ncbi:hypothetical protein, partial [Oceanobacter mangrovi]|uniref:hypothetical protein n=1 Tax=Oceanobacter mangrovi TaxID=2862510 RepID=UPI001C8EA18B
MNAWSFLSLICLLVLGLWAPVASATSLGEQCPFGYRNTLTNTEKLTTAENCPSYSGVQTIIS